jgi:hypothetical protein
MKAVKGTLYGICVVAQKISLEMFCTHYVNGVELVCGVITRLFYSAETTGEVLQHTTVCASKADE